METAGAKVPDTLNDLGEDGWADRRMALTTEVAVAEIIGKDDNDVGRASALTSPVNPTVMRMSVAASRAFIVRLKSNDFSNTRFANSNFRALQVSGDHDSQ
jgi:hypothetical protein